MASDQTAQVIEIPQNNDDAYIVAMSSRLKQLRTLMEQQDEVSSSVKKRHQKN